MSEARVFLSYNRADRSWVERIHQALEEAGVRTFFDQRDLPPGLSWPDELEVELRRAAAIVLVLGPSGWGPWQSSEKYLALERQKEVRRAGERLPVVPVLLPGAKATALGFLGENTWIEMTEGQDGVAIARLVRLLNGEETPLRDDLSCPYVGLRAFGEGDEALFYGREGEADALLERLAHTSFVALVGASGSGKSSLVQARVLPRLSRGQASGLRWRTLSFVPGDQPFASLAAAVEVPVAERAVWCRDLEAGRILLGTWLERHFPERVLLFVDQFEEVLTLTTDPALRSRFVTALLAARQGGAASLLVALRGDFYGAAIDLFGALEGRLGEHTFTLGPLRRSDVERAIRQPAEDRGVRFREGLVERIADDVGERPGRLPLLQFALARLWDTRQGATLTHAGYEAVGEVKGAIAQHAEEVYRSLGELERPLLRRLLARLVRLAQPDEGMEDTRRRVPLRELPFEVLPLVRRLTDERLLVTDHNGSHEETVELAHEALIREWQELRLILDADRAFLFFRQGLGDEVAQWREHGRDESYLLSGSRLAEAEEWGKRPGEDVSPEEQSFLAASRERQRREDERKARNERRLRWFLAATAAALVVAIGLGLLAMKQRGDALRREQAKASLLLTLRSQQALAQYPQRTTLLAAEALRLGRDEGGTTAANAETALRASLAKCDGEPLPLAPDDRETLDAVFGEKGRWLASQTRDGRLRLSRLRSDGRIEKVLPPFDTRGRFQIEFSPDGGWLATAGWGGKTAIWQLGADGATFAFETVATDPELGWNPQRNWLLEGGDDGRIRLWQLDHASSQPPFELSPPENPSGAIGVEKLETSPDGRWVAALFGHQLVSLWDRRQPSGAAAKSWNGRLALRDIAFSGDSQRLYLVDAKGVSRVNLAPMSPGDLVWYKPPQEMQSISTITRAWRSDLFLLGSDDWLPLFGPGDGLTLFDGAHDPPVWDRLTRESLSEEPLPGTVAGISPDGWVAIHNAADRSLMILRPEDFDPSSRHLQAHEESITFCRFTPDHSGVLTGTGDGPARLWSLGKIAQTPEEPRRLFQGLMQDAIFTPTGRALIRRLNFDFSMKAPILATLGARPSLVSIDNPKDPLLVGRSPDGRWLLTLQRGQPGCMWDLAQTELQCQLVPTPPAPSKIRFVLSGHGYTLRASNDGRWVALGFHMTFSKVSVAVSPSLWVTSRSNVTAAFGPWRSIAPRDEPARATFSGDSHWLVRVGTKNDISLFSLVGDDDRFRHSIALSPALSRGVSLVEGGREDPLESSPDGGWLVTTDPNLDGKLWKLPSSARAAVPGPQPMPEISSAAFSDDSRWLVSGEDGIIRIRDLQKGASPGLTLSAGVEDVSTLSVFRDGSLVFAQSDRSTLIRLDPVRQRWALVDLPTSSVLSADFSADGRQLLTAGEEGVFLWDLDLDSLLDKACTVTGRNLTCEEWREAFGAEPYRRTCANLPGPSDALEPQSPSPCE